MSKVEFLQKIISWAENNESVRMVIQTGSHVREDNTADELSDFDIELFFNDLNKFSSSLDWIKEIEEIWMVLPLENTGVGNPTRLVIFNNGIKVDFTLNSMQDFDKLLEVQKDSELFNRGYKILVDKDNLGFRLAKTPFKNLPIKPPSQKEFTALVEEFFFEAYHVAKYLKREDLWAVKFRDWTTKELFLRMLEWYEKSIHGWDYDTWHLGIRMKKWVEKDIYEEIKTIFAHFDKEGSWKTLEASMGLFRKVSKETASNLSYLYPEEVDNNLSEYINSLK